MSWQPNQRLPPVPPREEDLTLEGRGVTPGTPSTAPSKALSSYDQLQAFLGYGDGGPADQSLADFYLASRGTDGAGGSAGGLRSSLALPSSPVYSTGQGAARRHRSVSPMARSYAGGTEEAAGVRHLGMAAKRKGEHDLSPAQQRAFQFRSAINKTTMAIAPDLSPDGILESAAGFALPPTAPPPALTPALLDGLRPPAAPGVSDATLLGTMVLHKDLKPFSSSTRLPHQTSNGGVEGQGGMASHFMLAPVDITMADAYTYNVPPSVQTGEDAVRLFSSSAAKSGLIVYCNLNPRPSHGEYNPYDLVVVDRPRVDPRHYYVLTQTGVTQMLGGTAQDLQPFHAWQRDRDLFTVLRKLVFFKHNEMFQAFWQWRDAVRELKFRARQRNVSRHLLILSPVFQRALLNMRRMTLAVSSDTNGTWRKLPGGRWVELEAELLAPSAVPPRLQAAVPQRPEQLDTPSPPPPATGPTPVPQPAAPTASATASGAPNPTAAPQGPDAKAAAAPSSSPNPPASNAGTGTTTPRSPRRAIPDPAAAAAVPEGPEVAPSTPLPPERLPESGLPYQLGYVGTVQEAFSLSDWKHMREEQRGTVNSALQDMVSYVRAQIQMVGQAVQEKLAAAQAAVAKPTRQEARKLRFEAPSASQWKAKSVALARRDEEQRQRDLEEALHTAEQLFRFITLADALMLGQLAELVRLAVLLVVRQLENPRKAGLYIVAGAVDESGGRGAGGGGAGGGGLPSWGRSQTFASVALATMRRRNTTAGGAGGGAAAGAQRTLTGSGVDGSTSPRGLHGADGPDADLDSPWSVDRPAGLAFSFSPGSEELSNAVANLPREILHVVLLSASDLTSYPEVRQLLREVAAKGVPLPGAAATAVRAYDSAVGGATRLAGGYHGEVLRTSVDVHGMMSRILAHVAADYMGAMQHPGMVPYRGHEGVWALVSRFQAEAYRHQYGMSPEQLHADLSAVGTWLGEMSGARTSIIVGLVHLELGALQRTALPAIQRAHSGIMELLGALLVAQSDALGSRLAEYTSKLVARPSQLADFVAYVEVIWPHLDPMSATRVGITTDLTHMARLRIIYEESSPTNGLRVGSPTLYHPLYGSARPPHAAQDTDSDSDDPDRPPDPRKVRGTWDKLQARVAQYTDEARAAADYFQNAAGMMVGHFKTALIESGNTLTQILTQLRTGASTDPAAATPAVQADLDTLSASLRSLAAAVEQHSSWSRLLTHPSTTGLVASLEAQMATAQAVLAARRALWDVFCAWRQFLDQLYGVPCIVDERPKLMAELAEHVTRIRQHASKITALHTDDDLTSTKTVTPAEQKLGAHLSLLVKSWSDVLPLAQQLVHPAVKPRHLRTLLVWLRAHHAGGAAARGPGTPGTPLATPPSAQGGGGAFGTTSMQDPYVVPLAHVREEDGAVAEVAGRTSLAQLVSACSESPHTRELVIRITQVALGESQLLSWMGSMQDRLQALTLTYTSARVWGSFLPTNLAEVAAALGALGCEMEAVRQSTYVGGVLREYEKAEQLLAGVTRTVKDVSDCMDAWTFLCQLLSNPAVAERAPDANAPLEVVGSSWRKMHMAAMEQQALTAQAVALQDCRMLMAGLDAIRRSCLRACVPPMRAAYPRLWLVGDEVLLEALAVGGEVEALPPALLEGLYGGAVGLQVAVPDIVQDGPPPPPEVLAVVGASGELCGLMQPLPVPSAPGALRLEAWLPRLEDELRASFAAHTRSCVAACGQMPAEQWVASFPSQSVMLVDAVVWTQSVTNTLQRVAAGDRAALRNLLDQSVLRLETMARQLRTAMVSVPVVALYGGRQVEDLQARAAAAALTAAGTAAVVAAGPGPGDLPLDPDIPPTTPGGVAALLMARQQASAASSSQQPAPPFLIASTNQAAALAAAAAAAGSTAAAACAGPDAAASTSATADTASAAAAPGSVVATPYRRARRSAIIFDPSFALNAPGPEGSGELAAAAAAASPAVRVASNTLLTRQAVRGMERLMAAGVCHRQVVEDLIGGDVAGPAEFEWERNVRHYWDAERAAVEVALPTQRYDYGWEYDGSGQDPAELVLPLTVPSLLAAVSALQASPVVSLARGEGSSTPLSATRSLCALLGRLHMHMALDSTTSPASLAQTLSAAVQLNAWLSFEGAERLGLGVLSSLGEMLHALWSAAHHRQPQVHILGESLPSPWALGGNAPASPHGKSRAEAAQLHQQQAAQQRLVRPTPAVFLSVPLVAYLPVSHDVPLVGLSGAPGSSTAAAGAFLTEAEHLAGPFPHELCELVRRAGRCVTLHAADMGIALEAALRCTGLRDATEAARAVTSWYRLAAVQLSAPAQLRLDAVAVRAISSYVQREWMAGMGVGNSDGSAASAPPAQAQAGNGVGPAGAGRPSAAGDPLAKAGGRVGGSALDAVDAAIRAVVLPAADPEDLGLLSRLLNQVIGFAQRTPAPPEPAGGAAPGYVRSSSSNLSGSPIPFNVREALLAVVGTVRETAAALAPDSPPKAKGKARTTTNGVPASEPVTPARRKAAAKAAEAAAAAAGISAAAAAAAAAIGPAPPSPIGGGRIGSVLVAAANNVLSQPDSLKAPVPAWQPLLAPLANADAPQLVATAASLYDALLSHRAVLLVGAPGAGKSAVWRALVAATHGMEAVLPQSDAVLHVFPELLPCARLQLGPDALEQDDGELGSAATADGRIPTDWLLRKLQGARAWALRRRPDATGALVPVQPGSAGLVRCAPQWVVLDGPLGTPAAESIASLLLSSALTLPSGAAVASLSDAAHYVWETSDLARASPALLAAVPVVHVGEGVWDVEAAVTNGVKAVLRRQGMLPLVGPRLIRRLVSLLRFSASGAEAALRMTREAVRGSHGCVGGLGLVPGLVALFGEVVRTLDVPTDMVWTDQPVDLELALARCAIFACYWGLAGQVMGSSQRGQVESTIRDAALSSELPMALPLGGSLASWLVTPRRGAWLPWSSTLPMLAVERPGVIPPALHPSLLPGAPQPQPHVASSSAAAAAAAGGPHVECPLSDFHYFRDPRTGALGLFVPSAATQGLQYAAQLAVQAGLHPLLVGPAGSGRSTLLLHLLATAPMQQLRTQVVVAPACGSTSPASMQSLLLWHLSPGVGGVLRPTPGHRVVMVVEDVHVAAAGAPASRAAGALAAAASSAAAGDASPADGLHSEVHSPGAEWLRHVLDERALHDTASGIRLPVRGVTLAMTSSAHALLAGMEQLSGRVWRHAQHLHIDAAARCDIGGAMDGGGGGGGALLTTLFSRPAVCMALAQHTLGHLLHAGVPEVRAMQLGPAATVLAAVLESAMRAVGGLVQAGITPSLWSFDTAAVSAAMQRLCGAVAVANGTLASTAAVGFACGANLDGEGCAGAAGARPSRSAGGGGRDGGSGGPWGLREVLQRFTFELGRCCMGHVADGAAREALAKVMLQAVGRHLGALMTGRLEAALAAAKAVLAAPAAFPRHAYTQGGSGAGQGLAEAAAGLAWESGSLPDALRKPRVSPQGSGVSGGGAGGGGEGSGSSARRPQAEVDMDVVEAWSSYASRHAMDLTALRVSLAGRIPPKEMNLLLATLLGVLPPSEDDGENRRTGNTGGSYWYRHFAAAAGLLPACAPVSTTATDSKPAVAPGYGPGSLGTPPASAAALPGATAWLVPRPMGHRQVLRQVRAMLNSRDRQYNMDESSLDKSVSGEAGPNRVVSVAATAGALTVVPTAGTPGGGAHQRSNLGMLALELLSDTLKHWGYAEVVRPAASVLMGGYFCGGHVVLVGSNTPMLVQSGCLAALAAGASLTKLDRPTTHRANGGMPAAPPDQHSLRYLLLHHLGAALQALAHAQARYAAQHNDPQQQPKQPEAGRGSQSSIDSTLLDAAHVAGGLLPYTPDMAVAAGGFAAPGLDPVPPAESDPAAVLSEAARALAAATAAASGSGAAAQAGFRAGEGVGADGSRNSARGSSRGTARSGEGGSRPSTREQERGATSGMDTGVDCNGMQVILLTDGLLQDDSALELLQSLLCAPATAAHHCRELCDGSGLPLLKGLEPLVLDADLGQLTRHATSDDGDAVPITALMRAPPSGTTPDALGAGGVRALAARSIIARAFGAASPTLRRKGEAPERGSEVVGTGGQLARSGTGGFGSGAESAGGNFPEDAPTPGQPQQQPGVSTLPPMKSEADPSFYAASHIAELRAAELARAELALSVHVRLVRGLRFVLAASPATWSRICAVYPALAAALTPLHAVEPVVEDQHTSCTDALKRTAPHVADNTVPKHAVEDLNTDMFGESTLPAPGAGTPPASLPSPLAAAPAASRAASVAILGARPGSEAAGAPPGTPPDAMAVAAAAAADATRQRVAEEAALLKRVGEVVVTLHGQAQELYRQLGLLDGHAALPLSKVTDFVELLGQVHSSHRKVMQAKQATLYVCLAKLDHSSSQLDRVLSNMDNLGTFMDRAREKLTGVKARIAHLEKFIAEASAELADQEAKADATQAIVDQVHAEVDAELTAARQRLSKAVEEVGGLSEQALAEVRSYKEPHVLIRLVVMALCVLFEWPSDWRNAQRLMGEQNPKLLDRCRDFDVAGVSVVQAAKLNRLIQEPEFNVVSVEQVSVAAKSLCWWVLSVSNMLRVQKECDLRLSRIKEGEERLANTSTYIRRLRGELNAGKTELSRQQHDNLVLEQQIGEAGAQLKDSDLQKANIQKLSSLVQSMISTWRASLRSLEERLPTLVGDAALAVSAVLYLGPLDGRERAAVLALWRDLLQEHGVPVSAASYDLSAFVADRFAQMTRLLPPDLLANVEPLWRDNLALMAMALPRRPPLLLDPAREGANLIKAMFGKSLRVFLLLTEEGLLDKVTSAVRTGKAVVVDMYGTPSEGPLLALLVKRYEQVMRRTYPNLATEPHHLYLRLRTPSPCLSPPVHQYCTPVRFALSGDEMRARVRRTLLSSLAHEREVAARQMATKLWVHRARLQGLHDEITFTIAHTKGLIWNHPGLVDSTVNKANQVRSAEEEHPRLEADLADVSCALDRWRPLVDGFLRVHGVLCDMALLSDTRTPALPEAVLLSMFRSALRKGVTEVTGATGLVRELQGPTAPPDMSVEEARSKGAKALVSALLSHAPSRMASRGVSLAPSRGDSTIGDDAAAQLHEQINERLAARGAGSGVGGVLGQLLLAQQAPEGSSEELLAAHGEAGGMLGRFDSITSSAAGLPPGHDLPSGLVRAESTSSAWTTWTSEAPGSAPSQIAAAAAVAAQLLQAVPAAAPPCCDVEELAGAVLKHFWGLVCSSLGPSEATTFRLLLSVHEQLSADTLPQADAQLVLYVLGKGAPSAQRAAAPASAAAAAAAAATAVAGDAGGVAGGAAGAAGGAGPPPPTGQGAAPPPPLALDDIAGQLPQPVLQRTNSAAPSLGLTEPSFAGTGAFSPATAATDTDTPTSHAAPSVTLNAGGVSRPGTPPSTAGGAFSDPSFQAAVQEVLAHTPPQPAATHGSPAGGAPEWPCAAAMEDLHWLERCACDEDLTGLADAVAAAPRAWHAALAVDAMPPQGRVDPRARTRDALAQLPELWQEMLARKPAFKVLLTAILVPDALASAADAYSASVLGDFACNPDITPAERLLSVLMTSPAGAPLILATAPGEDPVVAAHQAQALCANGLYPVEPHRGARWDSAELMLRHLQSDPVTVRDIRAALSRCCRSGGWLLLLNAHTSPAALAALLEQLNAREYTLRGPDVTTRLMLAMPQDALARLHPNVLRQCVRVSLSPARTLRGAVASAMQTLAHPVSKRFVALFSRGSDIEVANNVLAGALLLCGLNRALSASSLPPVAPPLSTWDLLSASRLVRAAVMDARAADDSTPLDYGRLHELLAHEVLLPALPAQRLGRYVGWALQRLLLPGVMTLSYPVNALVDPDAEPGQELVATLPLNIRLPAMLEYLQSLNGVEAALQPPHATAHTLRARSAALSVALALHRLAAAPEPVCPARVVLLPEEHPQVAPLALQVVAAERVVVVGHEGDAASGLRRAPPPRPRRRARDGPPGSAQQRPGSTQALPWAGAMTMRRPKGQLLAGGAPMLDMLVIDGAEEDASSAVGTPRTPGGGGGNGGGGAGQAPSPRMSLPGMLLLQRLGPQRPGSSGSRLSTAGAAPGALICGSANPTAATPQVTLAGEMSPRSADPDAPPDAPPAAAPTALLPAQAPLPTRVSALAARPNNPGLSPLATAVPGSGSRMGTPGPLQQQLEAIFAAAGPQPTPSWLGMSLTASSSAPGSSGPSADLSGLGGAGAAGHGLSRFAGPAGPAAATVRLGTGGSSKPGTPGTPATATGSATAGAAEGPEAAGAAGGARAGSMAALGVVLSSSAPGPAPELAALEVWVGQVLVPLADNLARIEALLRGLRVSLESRLEPLVSLGPPLLAAGSGLSAAAPDAGARTPGSKLSGGGAGAGSGGGAGGGGSAGGAAAARSAAPQTLSVNLSALFAEMWSGEVRVLHDAVCNTLGGVEQLAAAAAEPWLYDSPAVRQLLRFLMAGFVPPGWRLPPLADHPCAGGASSMACSGGSSSRRGGCTGGGATSLHIRALLDIASGGLHAVYATTLEQWQADLRARVRQLQEVTAGDVDLRPAAVDAALLARPTALLACLVRAFAYEQNTHPSNVVCRLTLQVPPEPAAAAAATASGAAAGSGSAGGAPLTPLAGAAAAACPVTPARAGPVAALLSAAGGSKGFGALALPGASGNSGGLLAVASSGLGPGFGSVGGSGPQSLASKAALTPYRSGSVAGMGAPAYPIAAPRSMGLLGLHCRDLELPLLGLAALGLGLGLGLGAAAGDEAALDAAQLAGLGTPGRGGGGGSAVFAHRTISFTVDSSGDVGGSGEAGPVVPDVAAGTPSMVASATAAAAAASSIQHKLQQQQQRREAAAQEAQMALLQPCPLVYAVPGYADPSARKAMGGRFAFRPGGRIGGNSRAAAVSAAVTAGMPSSALPPPSVPVPLGWSPHQALLCDDPYRVAWECKPNSRAADAPPERLPVLAVARAGVEAVAADRGAVLRLGAMSAAVLGGAGGQKG